MFWLFAAGLLLQAKQVHYWYKSTAAELVNVYVYYRKSYSPYLLAGFVRPSQCVASSIITPNNRVSIAYESISIILT